MSATEAAPLLGGHRGTRTRRGRRGGLGGRRGLAASLGPRAQWPMPEPGSHRCLPGRLCRQRPAPHAGGFSKSRLSQFGACRLHLENIPSMYILCADTIYSPFDLAHHTQRSRTGAQRLPEAVGQGRAEPAVNVHPSPPVPVSHGAGRRRPRCKRQSQEGCRFHRRPAAREPREQRRAAAPAPSRAEVSERPSLYKSTRSSGRPGSPFEDPRGLAGEGVPVTAGLGTGVCAYGGAADAGVSDRR